MEIISGKIIDTPSTDGGDGLVLYGPDKEYLVDNCVFDFTKIPKSAQDELLSFVEGASGKVENCVFMNGIKALLIGNGDHPALDAGRVVEITNCVFLNIGRRCPEAQDGAIVRMKNCWIHDWGGTFDVRAFGSWAHRGAQIYAVSIHAPVKGRQRRPGSARRAGYGAHFRERTSRSLQLFFSS